MSVDTFVRAPFTAEQVEALNRYQQCKIMHPFTCGHCRDADEHYLDGEWITPDEHLLVATEAGWTCPTCDYTQDWAHDFMADGAWIERQVERFRSWGFNGNEQTDDA